MRAVRLPALQKPLVDNEIDGPPLSAGHVKVRIEACGICHSDAHYRGGFGNVATPRTLGHEIAGTVVGTGQRVAVHYLLSCGVCRGCAYGEQFCESGAMIGKQRDGGYAEFIVVPARNAIPIPPNVPTDVAALMMCSTATAYHALRVADFKRGHRVAILGFGGLGVSALHLCHALEAGAVSVVDVVPEKLEAAKALGAVPMEGDVDIAIDFTGNPEVITGALRSLAPRGTLVVVALSEAPVTFNPYRDLLGKERRIVGCSDHLREELFELMQLAASGKLNLSDAVSRRVPLEARAINEVLDDLENTTATLRNVIRIV